MRKGPWLATFAVFAIVLASSFFWYRNGTGPAALLLLGMTFIPFYARFESRKVRAEEIVLLAELAAIAQWSVSLLPLSPVCSPHPSSS